METAMVFSKLSYATRLKVGAIVVKDDRIISIGYNGTPSGWDNDCEYWFEDGDIGSGWKTKPEVLHAEENAILKLAKSNESGDGATLFITHAPCIQCAKMIYGAGIKEVFYKEVYRSEDGLSFLNKCNVLVRKIGD